MVAAVRTFAADSIGTPRDAIRPGIELYTATNNPNEAKMWRYEHANFQDVVPLPRDVVD